MVVVASVYDAVRAEFELRGAYFLTEEQKAAARAKVMVGGRLNADIVGQTAQRLAEIFGIKVPAWAKVLIAEVRCFALLCFVAWLYCVASWAG